MTDPTGPTAFINERSPEGTAASAVERGVTRGRTFSLESSAKCMLYRSMRTLAILFCEVRLLVFCSTALAQPTVIGDKPLAQAFAVRIQVNAAKSQGKLKPIW